LLLLLALLPLSAEPLEEAIEGEAGEACRVGSYQSGREARGVVAVVSSRDGEASGGEMAKGKEEIDDVDGRGRERFGV
jgi:hypothetical protein